MRSLIVAVMLCLLCLSVGGANALSISNAELAGLSFQVTNDPLNDRAGGAVFEVYGVGGAVANGFLYAVVRTNFPEAGVFGNDSYTGSTHFSPGDLYLNVGGTFQGGGGNPYGIATTSHGNVVTQAYATWGSPVSQGRLYNPSGGGPFFADGTFENYQNTTPTFNPDDGDGNNGLNSYPTLIRFGSQVGGDVSGVRYQAVGAQPWDFEIYYKVSLASLGIDQTGGNVQLFWAMECGNDGGQHFTKVPAIPEPTTVALIAAGVTAFAAHKRRNT